VILNAGIDETTVVVTAHREQSAAKQFAVPGGGVVEVPSFDGNANAYTVRGEGSLVALWATSTGAGTGTGYGIGVPVLDE
jgi:hypothetical protein